MSKIIYESKADTIADFLMRKGINYIFGVSGGRILPLIQAIGKTEGLHFVHAKNEQGAAYMADGYSRMTGNCGCCISTSGPGATNLLTGVAGAYYDSVPLIVITGQAAFNELGRGGIQEGSGINRSPDILGIYSHACKWSYRLTPTDNINDVLEHAYLVATSSRPGPVHLDIPTDLFFEKNMDTQLNNKICTSLLGEKVNDLPLENELDCILKEMKKAQNPVILAGQGVYQSKSASLLRKLQEEKALPVCTSLGGKGVVDEYNPLSLGMVGCYGQDTANRYLLGDCDLILAMGVSFQYLTSLGWSEELQKKKIIHVDYDNRELNRNITPEYAINCSMEHVIRMLLERLPDKDHKNKSEILKGIRLMKEEFGYYPSKKALTSGYNDSNSNISYLHPASLFNILSSNIEDEDVVVLDSGENAYWGMLSFPVKNVRQLVVNNGWGAMGYSLGSTIGVACTLVGSKGRAYGICGDGGFMMNLQEISTAVQHNLPCTWIIMNNECYGTQKHWQRDLWEKHYIGTDMPSIDFLQLASSMNLRACSVSTKDEMHQVMKLKSEGPLLIEVKIHPEVKPPQSFGSKLVK